MKNRIYIAAIFLSFIGMVAISCEEELSIKRDFDFEVGVEKYHSEIMAGETRTFSFHLKKEGDYENAEYFLSYFLLSGQGTLSDEKWNVLEENEFYKIPSDTFSLRYTAHKEGNHQIEFTVKDAFGREKEFKVSLTGKEKQ